MYGCVGSMLYEIHTFPIYHMDAVYSAFFKALFSFFSPCKKDQEKKFNSLF
jgi:hypothetical protein